MRGITHAGIFHAGDVFSTALLQIVYGDDFETERVEIVPEITDDEVIVYGIDNYENSYYQANPPVLRENGRPYATFGLLWKEFGAILVGDCQAEMFDENFVSIIDNSDVNGELNPMSLMVDYFNPDPDELFPDPDEAFFNAVDWAKLCLENAIIYMQGAQDFL